MPRTSAIDLTLAELRVRRLRAFEVDLLDLAPGHVLGPLVAADEDQDAGIPRAEVARRLQPQLFAGGHDRGDQAEGDGVVHALGWGVERLGGLALVEVEGQPAGEAAVGAGG